MMMEAVLSNADHPEYGVATIPLPIPRNQYDHCVALLEALEIGDASEADCRLDSLDSALPVLNRLVCTKVNLDELDYSQCRTVSEENFQNLVKTGCQPQSGDVLLVKDGATTGRVGMMTDDSIPITVILFVLLFIIAFLRGKKINTQKKMSFRC